MVLITLDPIAWFDELRESEPVFWHRPTGSWYVTRYSDVHDLLVDERLGARSTDEVLARLTPAQRASVGRLEDVISRWPVFCDPPAHTTLRRLLIPVFQAAATERVVTAVRTGLDAKDGSSETLRRACGVGLAALLEVPSADYRDISIWSQAIMRYVALFEYDEPVVRAADDALGELTAFVDRACRRRDGTLAAVLGRAVEAGEVELRDAVACYAQLITGALEPTLGVLAFTVEVLVEDPAKIAAFSADPRAFMAEAVRLACPFHFAPRRALRRIDVRGTTIPENSRVVLALVSANRDPRRFDDPDEFRADRANASNLSFGRGSHSCLGSGVAYGIVRAGVQELIDRRALSGFDVRWRTSLNMRSVAPAGETGTEIQ